eukprot:1918969-Pyramimonas_sp.AAC.1
MRHPLHHGGSRVLQGRRDIHGHADSDEFRAEREGATAHSEPREPVAWKGWDKRSSRGLLGMSCESD